MLCDVLIALLETVISWTTPLVLDLVIGRRRAPASAIPPESANNIPRKSILGLIIAIMLFNHYTCANCSDQFKVCIFSCSRHECELCRKQCCSQCFSPRHKYKAYCRVCFVGKVRNIRSDHRDYDRLSMTTLERIAKNYNCVVPPQNIKKPELIEIIIEKRDMNKDRYPRGKPTRREEQGEGTSGGRQPARTSKPAVTSQPNSAKGKKKTQPAGHVSKQTRKVDFDGPPYTDRTADVVVSIENEAGANTDTTLLIDHEPNPTYGSIYGDREATIAMSSPRQTGIPSYNLEGWTGGHPVTSTGHKSAMSAHSNKNASSSSMQTTQVGVPSTSTSSLAGEQASIAASSAAVNSRSASTEVNQIETTTKTLTEKNVTRAKTLNETITGVRPSLVEETSIGNAETVNNNRDDHTVVERHNNKRSETTGSDQDHPHQGVVAPLAKATSSQAEFSATTKSKKVKTDSIDEEFLDIRDLVRSKPESLTYSVSNVHHNTYSDEPVLKDIQAKEDIEKLNVRQLRHILKSAQIDYSDCVERFDLIDRVTLHWVAMKSAQSERGNETLPDSLRCKVCMDKEIDCVLQPCSHSAICMDCRSRLQECPICRGQIIAVVRLIRS